VRRILQIRDVFDPGNITRAERHAHGTAGSWDENDLGEVWRVRIGGNVAEMEVPFGF
jgi:hypothetical protein